MSDSARAYLQAALDTLQRVTLRSDTLPWVRIRDSAFGLARGAVRSYDTYAAIDWALRRANKHSFLQVSPPGSVSGFLPGRIGYLHVPQRGGTAIPLADSLHRAVKALHDSGACGWIVDLRANGGGNMWPMLAGIGPLLGDSIVGSFSVPGSSERWYYRNGASGIISVRDSLNVISRVTVPPVSSLETSVPVAVLIDGGTASSGEAVAIAFQGRPNTRSFGAPSAGFATVNRGARLADGANMVVTVGYNADRRGRMYIDVVRPDTIIRIPTGWPSPSDPVSAAASEWLKGHPGCR